MSPNLRGEGHIDFWCRSYWHWLWCWHQRGHDTFLSAWCFVNQLLDSYQIFLYILLGHNKDLIWFWWPWPNFQGHSNRKIWKFTVEGHLFSLKILFIVFIVFIYHNFIVANIIITIIIAVVIFTVIDANIFPFIVIIDELSVYPTFAGMFGGRMIDVSGPCFKQRSGIRCRFGEDSNAVVDAIYVSLTRVRCMVPRLTVRGRITLSLSIGGGSNFPYTAPFTVGGLIQLLCNCTST